MTALLVGFAALLCFGLTLSSLFTSLYIEALRLRPHPGAQAFEVFDDEVLPRLGLQEAEGVRRYTIVRQVSLILLTMDLTLLSMSESSSLTHLAEGLALSLAGLGIFGHVLPSTLISRTDGRWLAGLVPFARVMAWTAHPLVIVTGFANSVVELSGDELEPEKGGSGADEEIQAFLDAGEEEGLFDNEDRKLIQSVVEFGDKTVRDVLTPRPQVVAIGADQSVEELRELLIEEEYSRVPVFEESIDNVVGFVHGRDTLEVDKARRQTMKVRELVRPLALVPETKPIQELMRELQQSNSQMAAVIDEYGQTAGIVTMEDMMEEIVGEIRDETEPGLDVVEYPDHSFVASGNLDLDRLEELVGFRPDGDIESTTVGGFVCEHLGQVPTAGAKLVLDGIEIDVLSADERRIRSVRVRRKDAAATLPASQPATGRSSSAQADGSA